MPVFLSIGNHEVIPPKTRDEFVFTFAGAIRYALPPDAARAKFARTHVYGYLSAAVSPAGVVDRFGAELVHRCFQENAQN